MRGGESTFSNDCAICFNALNQTSMYDNNNDNDNDDDNIIEIDTCGHKFHRDCLEGWCASQNRENNCSCPVCRNIFSLNDLSQPMDVDDDY